MPRNDTCVHRGCDGGPCRMLTEEELAPSDEDMEAARVLIAEGWHSTSNKYRTVARFVDPIPPIEDMLRPEALDTLHGRRLAEWWRFNRHSSDLRTHRDGVEHRNLSIPLFRAFKKLGGSMA